MSQEFKRRELLIMSGTSLMGASLFGKTAMATASSESADSSTNDYIFPAWPRSTLEIMGTDKRFPVRRIYCIGLNYPTPPELLQRMPSLANIPKDRIVIFDKHPDAIVENGLNVPYPQGTSTLVAEVELVVAIGRAAVDIDPDQALDHVYGYAVGNDLTRKDLMAAAMKAGGAVDVAKAFDYSAPCGPVCPASRAGNLEEARIWLTVDGEIRQEGNLKDMLRKPSALISELSHLYHLQPGDLIYTGTPGIPGSVEKNETMVCSIDGLETLTNKMI